MTGHCSYQHARDIQDDVALGRVCDGARDAGSPAQSAGAAASGLVFVPFLACAAFLTRVAANAG